LAAKLGAAQRFAVTRCCSPLAPEIFHHCQPIPESNRNAPLALPLALAGRTRSIRHRDHHSGSPIPAPLNSAACGAGVTFGLVGHGKCGPFLSLTRGRTLRRRGTQAFLERFGSRMGCLEFTYFWLAVGSKLSRICLACRKSAESKPSVNWA